MSTEPKKVDAKTKVVTSQQTDKDLAKTLQGRVLLVIRKGFQLAKRNEFKGTILENSETNGSYYAKVKPSGTFWKYDEKSEEFAKLRELAKLAKDDIFNLKYTKKVQNIVDAILGLESPAGSRNFNVDILKDLAL